MKTKFGIVGCGFLGNIVADAWKKGLLEDYELVGVTSRTFASAEKTAASVGCAACADVDALLALDANGHAPTAGGGVAVGNVFQHLAVGIAGHNGLEGGLRRQGLESRARRFQAGMPGHCSLIRKTQ